MLSLSTRSFAPRGSSVAALLPAARALGFASISISSHDAVPRRGSITEARDATGVRIESLRAGCLEPRATDNLASLDEGRRARAVATALEHASFAASIGCRTIVLDGGAVEGTGLEERLRHLEGQVDRGEPAGELLEEIRLLARSRRDAHLDRLCRSIHAVARPNGELRFALLPASRPHEILGPPELAAVLSDLKLSNLGVRVDVGRSRAAERLGCEPLVSLLPAVASRLTGLDLHDARGLREHLPPGDGDVDWKLVAEHLPRAAERTLDLDVGTPAATIRESKRVFEAMGLA